MQWAKLCLPKRYALSYLKRDAISCKGMPFHAKMGTIKDRKTWTQQKKKILRRGGKNTQNYTKKVLMTQIITMVWSLT